MLCLVIIQRCGWISTMNRNQMRCCALMKQKADNHRISEDDFIEGAPELIEDIAASSASYDLHDKLQAYRCNGVCEYMARTRLSVYDFQGFHR